MAKDYMRFLAVQVISESKIVCLSKGSYITVAETPFRYPTACLAES